MHLWLCVHGRLSEGLQQNHTDVDPQPPHLVTVGPGMTEHAETNARSDYDDPKGYGGCRRK